MRSSLLEHLACPACSGTLTSRTHEQRDDEILEGRLLCSGCNETYPITRGVPRMNVGMEGLENVARSFGFEWKEHHAGSFESDTLFGRTYDEDWTFFLDCMGKTPDALVNAVVLDAGCGSGRFTHLIAAHGAKLAVGADMNEAVDEAFAICSELPNAQIVKGNVFHLPLKPQTFDLVWCSGVLHHTPDAAAAFRALTPLVKPGGTLYVWVYAKRFNPFRLVKSAMDALRVTRLPERHLLLLSKAISYPSLALLAGYRAARAIPPLRPRTAWGRRTVRSRNLREVQLTWFDALSPEYDSRHTEAEVVGWFNDAGFENVAAITEPKVGVRGTAPRKGIAEPEPVASGYIGRASDLDT